MKWTNRLLISSNNPSVKRLVTFMPPLLRPKRWTEVRFGVSIYALQLLIYVIEQFFKLRASIRAKLEKDGPLPLEVLTPPDSRDQSPIRPSFHRSDDRSARHKSKSPGRWRVIRAVSRATRSVVESVGPNVYGGFRQYTLHSIELADIPLSHDAAGCETRSIHSSP